MEVPPIAPVPPGGRLAPSFAQSRLWFLDQLEPGSPLYNLPAAVRLDGELGRGALAAALGEMVRRHEVLRTTFRPPERGGGAGAGRLAGRRHRSAGDRSHGAPRRRAPGDGGAADGRDARRPFDLARDRLLRASLLALAAGEHVALVTLHHIASDGWSMGVLCGELAALYAAFRRGAASPLPELAIQYADYAAWQRRWLTGERLEAELAYWRAQLAGAPPALELPTDHPRPAVPSQRGAEHALRLRRGDCSRGSGSSRGGRGRPCS